jgi:hypothetical protein
MRASGGELARDLRRRQEGHLHAFGPGDRTAVVAAAALLDHEPGGGEQGFRLLLQPAL